MKTIAEKYKFLSRLGSWIGTLRKSKGMGQDELTRRAGLSSGTLSRIENGAVDPQVTTVAKVANALGVSPAKILDLPKSSSARG